MNASTDNENNETKRSIREAFGPEIDPEIERRMRGSLDKFRRDLPGHPYARRLEGRRGSFSIRDFLFRPAALASVTVCLAVVVFVLAGDSAPTWAEVSERFQSAPFFSATIYMKSDALDQPSQSELWVARDGRARIRSGDQVVFSERGVVSRAFDLRAGQRTDPNKEARLILDKIGAAEEFSLETVMTIFGGRLVEATPLINAGSEISKDLAVFDLQSPGEESWFRVWALRESKLPLRILLWNPANGESVDVILTYSKSQPSIFFDPEAFAAKLKAQPGNYETLTYAFQKDPGGKPITNENVEGEIK